MTVSLDHRLSLRNGDKINEGSLLEEHPRKRANGRQQAQYLASQHARSVQRRADTRNLHQERFQQERSSSSGLNLGQKKTLRKSVVGTKGSHLANSSSRLLPRTHALVSSSGKREVLSLLESSSRCRLRLCRTYGARGAFWQIRATKRSTLQSFHPRSKVMLVSERQILSCLSRCLDSASHTVRKKWFRCTSTLY